MLRRVRATARRAGRLDATGELGTFGTAWLRHVRRRALNLGCRQLDIDLATLDGLDLGRADAAQPQLSFLEDAAE